MNAHPSVDRITALCWLPRNSPKRYREVDSDFDGTQELTIRRLIGRVGFIRFTFVWRNRPRPLQVREGGGATREPV